jgi:transcriptional regulator with XRE-family HTH domain
VNRIKELRDKRGLTLEKLSALLNTTPTTVNRLELGKRELTLKWIFKISEALSVQPAEIFGELLTATPASRLPVKGEVAAGIWKEGDVFDEPRHSAVPIGPDPRYMDKEQYALIVQGTSMNKLFKPGTFIVCVPWDELGRPIRHDDVVVVERRRDGMVEHTVKRVASRGRSVRLMPESDDPKWQESLALEPDKDGDEISIKALVVGKYEQF